MTRLPAQRTTLSKDRSVTQVERGRRKTAKPISLKNRQALALLQNWMSTPRTHASEWWANFEHELAETRPTFRSS